MDRTVRQASIHRLGLAELLSVGWRAALDLGLIVGVVDLPVAVPASSVWFGSGLRVLAGFEP